MKFHLINLAILFDDKKKNKKQNASIHSKAILYTEVLVSIKIVSELLYTFFSEINKIFCRVTSNAKD